MCVGAVGNGGGTCACAGTWLAQARAGAKGRAGGGAAAAGGKAPGAPVAAHAGSGRQAPRQPQPRCPAHAAELTARPPLPPLLPSPAVQALAAMKSATSKRVYYDFADMLRTNPTGNVPYTPILVRRGED